MRLANLAFIPLLITSCVEEAPPNKAGEPFDVSEPGKADGMLSATEKARFEDAVDEAVAAAEATIAKLETEIAKLEQGHAAKQKEADDLVRRIADREAELRRQADNNLLLCAFFPDPAICFAAVIIANDSTLKQWRSQLDAARAEQSRIAAELAGYRTKRDALRARIAPVREGKQQLLTLLQNPGTLASSPLLVDSPDASAAFGRVELIGRLETAMATEIELLVDIRNAAVETSQVLDESLKTLRALEKSVDELVTAQRERFMEALKKLISGDAGALAEKWLEEAIAAKTRELLKGLEWPASEFARFLIKNRNGGGDLDKLLQDILQKLAAGPQEKPPVTVKANTPVDIHDFTTAKSTLDMTDTRTPTRLEVFVDIQHTFSGDLVVSLVKDGKQFVLSKNVGQDKDDIVKTFVVEDLQGVSLKGRWTLQVEDTAKADVGRLRSWQLTAFGGTLPL
jgi:hypothetical protein